MRRPPGLVQVYTPPGLAVCPRCGRQGALAQRIGSGGRDRRYMCVHRDCGHVWAPGPVAWFLPSGDFEVADPVRGAPSGPFATQAAEQYSTGGGTQ